MDKTFQSVVSTNKNIAAVYFNSYDDMNRLYPFIDKVYDVYGEHIHMEDYNFYYLADKKHNPKKKPVWTDVYLDPAGNGWMMSCIAPIYNNDFLEGVTGLDITIESLVNNILDKELPYSAKMFMLDSKGTIIAMPKEIENILGLQELKKHSYTDVVKQTVTKPEEFNIYENQTSFANNLKNMLQDNINYKEFKIDDKEYIAFQHSVKETEWRLMILVEKENIFEPMNKLKSFSNLIGYIAMLIMAVFYMLFIYILSKKSKMLAKDITLPIEQLNIYTSHVGDANFEIKEIDTTIKEVYELNENFSKMITELDARTKSLVETELLRKEKEAEASEYLEANKVAEEAIRSKSTFLANMSHEIRTPMNAILGFVEILANGEKDQVRMNQFKIVQESTQSLLTIINDILDISKIESGKFIIEKTALNSRELFENITLIFEGNSKKKNIDFSCEIENDVPYMILGDFTRIRQVVFNLLSNAIKFTDENGTVDLNVKYNNSSQMLYCCVSDSGIGIAPENISKIFKAFEQEDSSTTRKFGGTGLGLSISSKLIEIMGGELNVESVLGQGSKFYFSIPAPKHNDIQGAATSNILSKDSQVQELSGKVLLVDDIGTNQMLLSLYLEDFGLEYDIANNGQEAVEMFEKNRYDIILMDEQMPVMSGIEATEHIRNIEKEQELGHIQIIAVTANALADDRKRLLESGMDDYLSKPIDIKKLEEILRNHLSVETIKEN